MSLNFSAQQYDAAFRPKRLGNWEVPKTFPQLPRQRRLCDTQFVANERGHLRPELKCGRKNPFCTYIGTYLLPRRITREFAQKLSRFPHDYSVLSDINDSRCRIKQKCFIQRNETPQEQRFRDIVRKCIRENAEENRERFDENRQYDSKCSSELANSIDNKNMQKQKREEHAKTLKDKIYEGLENAYKKTNDIKQKEDLEKEALGENIKDEIMRSLKEKDITYDETIHKDILNKGADRNERNSDLRKIVQKCIEDNKIGTKDAAVDSKQFKDKIKDCVKTSLKDNETNKEYILREKVQRCIDEMKKDERHDLTENDTKQHFKERVKKCVERENESRVEIGKDAMREAVKECIEKHKPDQKTLNKDEFKDKVKKCVREKERQEENVKDKIRDTVRECMKENKSDQETLKKDEFKDKIKRCVKEKEKRHENVKDTIRDTVRECMKEHKSNQKTLNKDEFKDKIKRCVKEKERRDENFKDTMRDTVRECIKEHESVTKSLNKDEFKHTIKRCVEEKYKKENSFRQAVRESIPKKSNNMGKGDSENDPEKLRKAVQECIKEKSESKADKPAAEFKKVVKDCALQKIRAK